MFLVIRVHLDLTISREPFHEGHVFKTTRIVDNDICNRDGKLVFREAFIEIPGVDIDLDLSIFLSDKNNVCHLIRMLLYPDEARLDECNGLPPHRDTPCTPD